jgi:hypothetical protein
VTEAIGTVDPEKIVGIVFNNDDQTAFGDYSYYNTYDAYTPEKGGRASFNWFKKSFSALFHSESKE